MSTNNAIKLVTTKLAKQVSGYALLKDDMEFAARVFGLAAKRHVRSVAERQANRPSAEAKARLLFALDPILRAGASVGQFDEDNRNESEVERCALFEAGIVTYGRCFSSGARTGLPNRIFVGALSRRRELHDAIMAVRNKHIAHSELKMEQSIVGCQLIDDQNYGKRLNLILTILSMRRDAPKNDRLTALEAHCRAIVHEVIEPKILKSGRALREQLLQMPAEQIAKYADLGTTNPTLEELL